MKIGYTVKRENIKYLENYCDEVYYAGVEKLTPKSFLEFIMINEKQQIIIKNVEDIGLQLVQMLPALEELKKQKKEIKFLEKNFGSQLSDKNFNRMLLNYARNEKEIMSDRTLDGIEEAKKKGIRYGRPKVSQDIIQKIRYLSLNQERSIREIAEICGVSIGTVHKYASKEES